MSDEELEAFKATGYDHLKAELQQRLDAFCAEECPNDDHSFPAGEPATVVVEGDPSVVILQQAKKHEVDFSRFNYYGYPYPK